MYNDSRMARTYIQLSVLIALSFTGISECLFIDGCPLYGCRPSGSFSFYLDVPTANASINWQTSFDLQPVPNALGCSSDSVSIVCQSNGPFSDNKGYVSLYHDNGTVRWRDGVLYFPTLPILDNYGDVTGSDGVSLVHFDADGKNYPIIPCQNMKPIFSMQLVGEIFLLMVSQLGGLSVRNTMAVPVAEIFLNDTVQRTNGTFLPISQPVVNGNRFYLLTEFVPNSNQDVPTSILNLQRLYAIDIHDRMADIMTIAWTYSFEMLDNYRTTDDTLRYQPQSKHTSEKQEGEPELTVDTKAYTRNFRTMLESITGKQILLWDENNSLVYVTLPPPYASNRPTTFWGLRDDGNSTSLAFRTDLDVTHMAMFEANDASSAGIKRNDSWRKRSKHSVDIKRSHMQREQNRKGSNISFELYKADRHHKKPIKTVKMPGNLFNKNSKRHDKSNILWASLANGSVCSIKADGNLSQCIDLGRLVGSTPTITSKISLVRGQDSDNDILLFGITVPQPTDEIRNRVHNKHEQEMNNTSFVIALDTAPLSGRVLWVVPVPDNLEVKGQITGSGGADYREKDQIVVFANTEKASAKIFTIN